MLIVYELTDTSGMYNKYRILRRVCESRLNRRRDVMRFIDGILVPTNSLVVHNLVVLGLNSIKVQATIS